VQGSHYLSIYCWFNW